MAAPAASERKPVTAIRLPMLILVISAGSGYFFDHSRQKTTAPARQLTDKIESRVISQVVGCWLPMTAIVNTGKSRSNKRIAVFSRLVRRGFTVLTFFSTTGESGGRYLRP